MYEMEHLLQVIAMSGTVIFLQALYMDPRYIYIY